MTLFLTDSMSAVSCIYMVFFLQTRCNELGGYLVEIEDEDENTWLVSTFPVDERKFTADRHPSTLNAQIIALLGLSFV